MLKTSYLAAAAALAAAGILASVAGYPDGALVGFPALLIAMVHALHGTYRGAPAAIPWLAGAVSPGFAATLIWVVGPGGLDAFVVAVLLLLIVLGALAIPVAVRRRQGQRWPATGARPTLGAAGTSYLLATLAVGAAGISLAADDVISRPFLFGIGLTAAWSFCLTASVNALNWRYGHALGELRRGAPWINLLLLFLLWSNGWMEWSAPLPAQVMFIWIPALLTLLSLWVRAGRPSSGRQEREG